MIGNGPPIPPLTNVLIKNNNNPLTSNTTTRELPTVHDKIIKSITALYFTITYLLTSILHIDSRC